MRLICPKCDANYEVDASVIPENGRDVQCSACGETWFQTKAGEETVAEPQPRRVSRPVTRAEIQPPVAPPEEDETSQAEPQRRELDESVLDILREEAAREEIARAEEQDAPDLAEALAEQVGEETPPQEEEAHGADLLPDIDAINSTLQADAETEEEINEEKEAAPVKSSGGFRRGFTMMLLLIILAAVIYTSAPKIIELWPAGEPYLTAYVNWVDGLRASLDSLMGNATESLSSLTEGS